MAQNRRNYYRILRVQPDASLEVIRRSYRTLLQKLRVHPDLGGEHRDAAMLNEAWVVLKDPAQRATYDRELLARYGIDVLSRGGHKAAGGHPGAAGESSRRHHYRTLQVQPDAPRALIEASWNLLRAKPGANRAVLDKAWEVIGDATKRAAYDRVLRNEPKPAARGLPVPVFAAEPSAGGYRPLISHYCPFCKTPYAVPHGQWEVNTCIDCASPLAGHTDDDERQSGRAIVRFPRDGALRLHLDWPSRAVAGKLADLSATGALFYTQASMPTGAVVKVASESFDAIAKIAHQRPTPSGRSTGMRFITVRFAQTLGGFVSTTA